jgi:hypothetical protein
MRPLCICIHISTVFGDGNSFYVVGEKRRPHGTPEPAALGSADDRGFHGWHHLKYRSMQIVKGVN